MKRFRMKKLWKAISLSLCGILTAGIIAGCGSENTVDKTTLKFGVTNFADTLMKTGMFSQGLRKVGLLVMII